MKIRGWNESQRTVEDLSLWKGTVVQPGKNPRCLRESTEEHLGRKMQTALGQSHSPGPGKR